METELKGKMLRICREERREGEREGSMPEKRGNVKKGGEKAKEKM